MHSFLKKCLFLCLALLLAACHGAARTDSPARSAAVTDLARQAQRLFETRPRTAAAVSQALQAMRRVLQEAGRADSLRFDYFVRAANYAIWLSYHSGEKKNKSTYAKEALNYADRAVSLANQRVEGYYYRAIANGLLAQSHTVVARPAMLQIRRDLRKAIGIDPAFDFGGPHRVLGALYLRAPGPPAGIGSIRRALFHLQKAFELAPDYPENLLFLAEACYRDQQTDRAKSLLSRLGQTLAHFGDDTDKKDWMARAEHLQKEFDTE